jgi:hypothetical protein
MVPPPALQRAQHAVVAAGCGIWIASGSQQDGAQRAASLTSFSQRALAVNRTFAIGVEGLPRHALRIGNPLLVGSRVAAGRVPGLDNRPLGTAQAVIDIRLFGLILGLDAEMRDAGGAAGARADREIHPRILEHPFDVIVLDDRRLGREQGRVEPRRLRQIVNRHVHVQPFHRSLPW